MKLSPSFSLHEFTRSDRALRIGRPVIAPPEIIDNLTRLCVEALEPVRKHFDAKPITVLSGYRPDWLNREVGGSRTSEHLDGRAVDFIIHGFTPLQVCRGILPLLPTLPINQLIYEFGEWTHVSVCAEGTEPRRQVLTAHYVGGVKTYSAGLVG